MFKNPLWWLSFLRIIKDFINPAIEIVEAIKKAVRKPEEKFLDLLFALYPEGNAFEEACKIVRDAIARMDVASTCGLLDSDTEMIDCFVTELRKQKKVVRNAIYRQLVRELTEMSLNTEGRWSKLSGDQKDTVVQFAYSRKKTETEKTA